MKANLWCIGMTCYASSHDDFIGVFSSEGLANKEADRLNQEYLMATQQTTYPFDIPPYYVFEHDISKWLHFAPRGCSVETWLKNHPVWINVMTVPSLGEFNLYPKGVNVFEEFKMDEVKVYEE